MLCKTAEVIISSDFINATNTTVCFCPSDDKVVVVFSSVVQLFFQDERRNSTCFITRK